MANTQHVRDLVDELASEATDTMGDYVQLKFELEIILDAWGIPFDED